MTRSITFHPMMTVLLPHSHRIGTGAVMSETRTWAATGLVAVFTGVCDEYHWSLVCCAGPGLVTGCLEAGRFLIRLHIATCAAAQRSLSHRMWCPPKSPRAQHSSKMTTMVPTPSPGPA